MNHTAKLYSWLVLRILEIIFPARRWWPFTFLKASWNHEWRLQLSSGPVSVHTAGFSATTDTCYQVCLCSNETFKEVLMLNFWQFLDSSLNFPCVHVPYSIFFTSLTTLFYKPCNIFRYYHYYQTISIQTNGQSGTFV